MQLQHISRQLNRMLHDHMIGITSALHNVDMKNEKPDLYFHWRGRRAD